VEVEIVSERKLLWRRRTTHSKKRLCDRGESKRFAIKATK
jgi:hypothetical protein